MAMRSRLKRYVNTRKEIAYQRQRLETLREEVGFIRSPSMDLSRSRFTDNKQERLLIRLEEMETKLSQLIADEAEEYEALERIVCKLNNPEQRAIIRMRYFDLMEWPDIVFTMFGDRVDFITEEEDYRRRSYRIHTKAVSTMASISHRRD